MADPRTPMPGGQGSGTAWSVAQAGFRQPRKPKTGVIIALIVGVAVGISVLIGLAYVVSQRMSEPAPQPTAEALPRNLCDVIGRARLSGLVVDATTRHRFDSSGSDTSSHCVAESDTNADPGHEILDVFASRFALLRIGSEVKPGEESAGQVFESRCRELAEKKIGKELVEVPIRGLDTLGDRGCGKAAFSSASKRADVLIVVLRGPDVLEIIYDADETDDTTPQREMVALVRDLLAKL